MCTCRGTKISFCFLIMVPTFIKNMKIWSLMLESMEFSLILLIHCSIIWLFKKIPVNCNLRAYYVIIQLLNRMVLDLLYLLYFTELHFNYLVATWRRRDFVKQKKNKINLKSRRCMTQKAENNKKLSFDMLILSCNLDLLEYIILST